MEAVNYQVIVASIEAHIKKRYQVSQFDSGFQHDINLWEQGYLDSLGVTEVVEYLEHTFDVSIPESSLFDEQFGTIAGMARIVESLRRGTLEE